MSPDIEFSYDRSIFTPPAPIIFSEWRSPASEASSPKRLPALIDSGADCCAVPQSMIDSLQLCQVDECPAGGYDDKEGELPIKPIYSIHLTIPPLDPILAEVIPKESENYAIIGRDIINEWLLTLDGPNLKTILKSAVR